MNELQELEQQLATAGKFDKLTIYCQILHHQYQHKDPKLLPTFFEAIKSFQDYLEFDPKPPLPLRNSLTEVFYYTFQALRFYLGGGSFSDVYASFVQHESCLVASDYLANIFADLSFMFWCKNDHTKALEYGKQSLNLAEQSDTCDGLPGRYSNVGFIYESQSDYHNAELYYAMGLNYGLRINSERVKSLAYCGFGRVNAATGNFKAAINYFLEALKLLEDENSEEYMTVCSNLGTAYGKLGDYQESLKYFLKFVSDKIKKTSPELYYSSVMNSANCYFNLGDLDKAEQNLLIVVNQFNQHHNLQAVTGALLSLGRIKTAQGLHSEALAYYRQSQTQIAQTGNKIQAVLADLGMGTIYLKEQKHDLAITALKKGLKLATALQLKSEMIQCNKLLSELYENTGIYDKALKYYKQYQALEMEIKNEQFNLDIKNIKNQYEKKVTSRGSKQIFETHTLISVELAKLVKTPLIGTSKAMRDVLNKAMLCAENDLAPVLITGESGTGKEIIARIIHYSSARKKAPYIAVNSVAFSDSLVESSFFGSEKGSFTGSIERKQGYFEAAHRGTLFLDEIGDMSLAMQSKLLRVLEEHIINRVGGTKDITIDFRLISATNKNLYELTQQNLFRFDLQNRVNTLEINLPPLRERQEDIPLLVDYFISIYKPQWKPGMRAISIPALQLLCDYPFPGNVRELKNIIQRSILLCNNEILEPDDIVLPESNSKPAAEEFLTLKTLNLEAWEQHLIQKALAQSGNVQAKAATLLGISPFALNRKLKKFTLQS